MRGELKGNSKATTPLPEPDIEGALRGDVAAFERIYRANVSSVYALANRILGTVADAEDATQEVFIRAWEKLSSFRGDASLSTWLMAIARNTILNRARANRLIFEEINPDDLRITSAARRPEDRIDLEAAIRTLPGCARTVFVLHDIEGLRHSEIASSLDINIGTSKSQLHRARMLLRHCLKKKEG